MKTLGICIPTYKRPELLRKCVLSIIREKGDIPVNIYIADDSVSDTNDKVISELTASCDFIFYKKNQINLGIDDNIQVAVDFCSSDYAWIIGEDDIYLTGSIERIYKIIQSDDFDFIFSNYRYANETHTKLLDYALNNVETGKVSSLEFIENHLWSIGFIGACIVKTSSWKKTDAEIFKDTYYTHVGRIVDMIVNTDYVYLVKEANVANRAQGSDTFTWKEDSFGVFLGFEKMCKTSSEKHKQLENTMERAIVKFRKKMGYFSIKTLLRLRAENSYDFRQYKKYIVDSDLQSFKRICFFSISILPSVFFLPILYMYRKIL